MKKLFTMRLILVSLFSVFTLMMKAVIITHSTEDGFTYKLNTDKLTAELVGYSGTAIEIAIPESVTYETVVYGVISLGEKCFYDCSSITSIKIPTSVISLGDWCFSCCKGLKTIQIPSSITTIGRYCFSSCSTLNSIDITSPIKTIPEGCFHNCESLSSIVIPSSVETLEGSSFEKCTSLTSLYIPAAVKSLGLSCFRGCTSIESIKVDENNRRFDSRDNCNGIIESSSNTMVFGCMNTIIPSTVRNLGWCCFYGCSNLKSIYIPASIISLDLYCLADCSSLSSIVVDSDNPVYDSRDNCNGIIESSSNTMVVGCKNTVIPTTVTNLNYDCFFKCSSLTSIKIPNSVKSIGFSCFVAHPDFSVAAPKKPRLTA